eukprot:Colp12_sorted_trinity150504_noHs@13011
MASKVLLLAILGSLAGFCLGHISANPGQGAPNSYLVTGFVLPHGAKGNLTTDIWIQIPTEITTVRPRLVQGFDTQIVLSDNGTVSMVKYVNGSLPNEFIEIFTLNVLLPDVAEGTILFFPVYQRLSGGSWLNWTDLGHDDHGSSDSRPAPSITVSSVLATDTGAASSGSTAAHGESDFGTSEILSLIALIIASFTAIFQLHQIMRTMNGSEQQSNQSSWPMQ